jgi:outer membrane protein insertion porin family
LPSRSAAIAALLALAAAFFAAQPAYAAESGLIVKKIDVIVSGPFAERARIETDVRRKMNVKEGAPYSPAAVDDAVKTLYTEGPYEVVPFIEQDFQGGVRIELRVRKRIYIASITFDPSPPSIDVEEAQRAFMTEPGRFLVDDAFIKNDKSRVEEALRQEGYAFAEVETVLREAAGGYDLVFKCNPGPRVRVGSIEFRGNSFYAPSDLLGRMETSALWDVFFMFRLSFLVPGTLYVEERVKSDAERIEDYYHKSGFLDAHAALEERRFGGNFDRVAIAFRIHEGSRYTVRSVAIEGNRLFTSEFLLKAAKISAGDPLTAEKADEAVKAIKTLYDEKAYIYTAIDMDRRFDYAGSGVDLVFRINEGGKAFIEKIDIRGNTKTRSDVIRRELSVYPGEPFNMVELQRSMYRLFGTGYFSKLDKQIEDGSRENWKKLVLEVEEQNTGSLLFGFAYSNEAGLVGRMIFSQNNFDPSDSPESFEEFISGKAFTGGGQQFGINLQPGDLTSSYTVYYNAPYVFGSRLDLSSRLFYFNRFWSDYSEDRSGFSFGFSKRLEKDVSLGLTFNLFNVAIFDIKPLAPLTVYQSEGDAFVSSVTPGLRVTKLQIDRHTTRYGGYQAGCSYELASRLFGSDVDYGALTVSGTTYFKTLELSGGYKHTLCLKGMFFDVHELSGSDFVPVYELGFLGGMGTLRGFAFRQVGPRENDRPTGGRVMATCAAEYSIPVPGVEDNIYFFMFGDAGNVAWSWNTFALDEFRTSLGWGLRIKLGGSPGAMLAPMLELDFGYPVRMMPGDERNTFSFSITTSF